MFPSDDNTEWKRVEVIRRYDFPAPSSAIWEDGGEGCVCLKINVLWVPFILGALDILDNPHLWTGDPEPALTSIGELMLALMGGSDLMNCDPAEFIKNITFEGGVINVTYGDDTTTVVEGTERIVTAVNAIGGGFEVEQGGEFEEVPNPEGCGDCDDFPDQPAYDKSENARSCAIAYGLTEFLHDKYNDQIDEFEAAADIFLAADAWSLIFPPAYILFDQTTDAIGEMAEAGTSSARAWDTTERREEFATELYCRLIENGHEMTPELWQDFKDNYLSQFDGSPVQDYYRLYFEAYKIGGIIDRAHKESYREDGICETYTCGQECVDFSETETYEVVKGEWGSGFGESGAGVRYVATALDDWIAQVVVDIPTGVATEGLSLRVHTSQTINDNATRTHYLWVRGVNGATVTNLYGDDLLDNPQTDTDDTWYTMTANWTSGTYEAIRISVAAGGSVGGNLDLRIDNVCLVTG